LGHTVGDNSYRTASAVIGRCLDLCLLTMVRRSQGGVAKSIVEKSLIIGKPIRVAWLRILNREKEDSATGKGPWWSEKSGRLAGV